MGEALAVEFANTRYGQAPDLIDFLGDRELARAWIAAALGRELADAWRGSPVAHRELRELRDAVHALLEARVHGAALPGEALTRVNASVAKVSATRSLELDTQGEALVRTRRRGKTAERLEAQLAEALMELVGTPAWSQLRRCPGPGCSLFFVAAHHRRRFCHPSCSHRARQAAYYRRRQRAQESGESP